MRCDFAPTPRRVPRRVADHRQSTNRCPALAPVGGWESSLSALRVGRKPSGPASAVRASGPTARPAHASAQLIDADLNAAFSRLFFLGRCNPTDPLVSRQWGDIGPDAFRSGIGFDGFPKVYRQFVHRAARNLLSSHTSNRACFAQRKKLSHAGPKTVNREAELTAPTGVGSSDLLGFIFKTAIQTYPSLLSDLLEPVSSPARSGFLHLPGN